MSKKVEVDLDLGLDLDLDINNYGYAELLTLFKLDSDYGEKDLKEAKKIVLKMHPDKSKLPSKYFLFFSKAFKAIVQIYEFKNKSEKKCDIKNVKEYKEMIKIVPKKGDENSRALKKFVEENDMSDPLKFNAWFNGQFDKAQINASAEDDGYEEWFKTNQREDGQTNDDNNSNNSNNSNNKKSKEEISREFAKKKAGLKSMIKYEGVQEMYSNDLGASALYGSSSGEGYNSGLFTALSYQDLRQSHIETVIPVSEDDFEAIPKFNTVDEYQRHRDSDRGKLVPLSEKEANKQFASKERALEDGATKRAFYYAKQVEENEKKTDTFWASIKQLTNF
jgi:hypothetical protein